MPLCVSPAHPQNPHRYPVISGRHVPTEWGLAIQRQITFAKVWLATKLMQLTGNSRHASKLMTSFKAFCVQNTIGYARSIVSCVDNALELRESIVPEEQADWPCVWQAGKSPAWLDYACSCLTGEQTVGAAQQRWIRLSMPPDRSACDEGSVLAWQGCNHSVHMLDLHLEAGRNIKPCVNTSTRLSRIICILLRCCLLHCVAFCCPQPSPPLPHSHEMPGIQAAC